MYKKIGPWWHQTVKENETLLQLGRVKIKFFVRADGVIDQMSVVSAPRKSEVLQTISTSAIKRVSDAAEPFSDILKQELGEGYWDDISFTIYPPGKPPKAEADADPSDISNAPAPAPGTPP